jgi:hypothetical protein
LRAPIAFIYGNCVFAGSLADPWAAFVADCHTYDCLGATEKQAHLSSLVGALEAAAADFQILRVSRRMEPERYRSELERDIARERMATGAEYARIHARHLAEAGAEVAVVFVIVRLREPDPDLAAYASGLLGERRGGRARRLLGAPARALDRRLLRAAELEQVRLRADRVHARLLGFIPVRPARTVELQWLVRRGFCRGLGEPEVDGMDEPRALAFECNGEAVLAPLEGDLVRWTDGFVHHRGRLLQVASELGTSWQAHLVAGALPECVRFPSSRVELMFAPPESLPFALDLALCARFLPNGLAVRLARRKIQDADQILHAESVGEQGPTDQGYDRTQAARDLLSYLQSASRPPLLRATLAVAVGAADEQALEERVELCRRAFGEVRLHRPFGDQLELFCQHLPGQSTRVLGYDDILTCEQAAAMMPTATHVGGSRGGFHLGCALSGSRRALRFDLREGSAADRGAAILSVGALGAGKTTLDQKLKYEAFLLGARIVDCDPKGDHRFHLLDEVAPHVRSLPLRPDAGLRGVLDPLRVAPAHLRQESAVSFLCDLLPPRAEPAWEAAIVRAVDAVIERARDPGCGEVVSALAEGGAADAEVARTLAVYARSGLTQLAFAARGRGMPAIGAEQVTYLPIRDLPGPEPGTPRRERSHSERVGQQLVRLVAMLAMRLMGSEPGRLKVFSFDEGWRLLGDPVGRTLLASLQRMGRSELAVPIISTQLVADTAASERETLHNLLGAIFVFGMRAEDEITRALQLLGMDPSDRRMRRRLLALDAGRCLFRDHQGRVEAIQVEVVAPALLRAFSTTPRVRRNV